MAALNLTDPLKPSFSYQSDGATVSAERECPCGASEAECIRQCHQTIQALLDAALLIWPEDA
jgi:hypothetical protein